MAVARDPDAFDENGLEWPPGGVDVLGMHFDVNPKRLLTEQDWAMARIWGQSRGGMGGVGHLPEAGGVMAQLAIMLEALAIMNGAAAELDAAERERGKGGP